MRVCLIYSDIFGNWPREFSFQPVAGGVLQEREI